MARAACALAALAPVEAALALGAPRALGLAEPLLDVHDHEAKVFEVVRVSYLPGNGRAVVSERGADAAEEGAFEPAVAFAPCEGLVDARLDLLGRPEERRRLGEAGRALMRARPQAASLAAALGAR